MKAMAIILGLLIISGRIFAVETLNLNQTIALDVLGQNPMTIDATVVGEMKEIKIQNEYSGFECFVDQVQSTKSTVGGKAMVSIAWSPGADLSGCEVVVTGTQGSATAALYMNY